MAWIVGAPVDAAPATASVSCLTSGDGYLRARLDGDIEAAVNWPNAGTRCEGEERPNGHGIRMSFHRDPASRPDLLFVFGISNVKEGQAARSVGVNITVILQGSSKLFGTRGDSRCTIDALTQTPLLRPGWYRVEARGFCTQPARAVRGDGEVLLTTFDFAGPVMFSAKDHNP